MSITLDGTALTIVVGAVGSVVTALVSTVVYLYQGREKDRAAYMAEMLSVAKTLREEDARENAELRAKLEAVSAPPSQRTLPPRRKSR